MVMGKETVVLKVNDEQVNIGDVLSKFFWTHFDRGSHRDEAEWFADAARAVHRGEA